MLFECTVNATPCPVENQVAFTSPTLDDFAQLGITSGTISMAWGVGFAIVCFFALFAFSLHSVLQMIRKI